MPTILVVDDDPHVRQVVVLSLRKEGFTVDEAADGRAALDRIKAGRPDLVVLDIMMPEMDGLDVCRSLRPADRTPIVFLSSKDDEIDRVIGLELGGDDYLTKPFSPRELVARVKAVLRRLHDAGGPPSASQVLEHGRLRLDPERFSAAWDGTEVPLTVTEFNLLKAMLSRPGRVFTRDNLMDHAYDLDADVSDRTIDSHVRRVRAKFARLGGNPVETVHGLGYRLGQC